jgi:hypothetical protein
MSVSKLVGRSDPQADGKGLNYCSWRKLVSQYFWASIEERNGFLKFIHSKLKLRENKQEQGPREEKGNFRG